MRLLAAAKINLHLRVFGARSDGFHPLLSWMCAVGLFDTIEISEAPEFTDAPERSAQHISLRCDDPSIPCDETNLVHRAAHLILSPGDRVNIHLTKRIPSGGGLGGGSSDGARTLMGLNRLFKIGLPIERLSELAAKLGSDVPFFLHGPSSVCEGRGEIVTPIATPKPKCAVLILPRIAMPTPRVYQVFDSLELGKARAGIDQPGPALGMVEWEEWTSLKADELLPRLINDLETPAFTIEPKLGKLRSDLEQALGRIVRMSGSGSTLFTLFDDQPAATAAAETISRSGTHAIAVELGVKQLDDV